MRGRALTCVVLVALTTPALAAPAAAPLTAAPSPPDAIAAGAALIAEGEAFGKQNKYELALERFRAAADAHPSALHDCYVALTFFRLGDLTSARLYLDNAPRRGDAVPGWCSGKLEDQLTAELARRGFVAVAITVTPTDAVVGVGAVRVRGGHRRWLPPGPAVIVAELDGYARLAHDVVVPLAAPAGDVAVDLRLRRATPPAVRPAARAAPRRWPGYATLAGGVALVAGGAAFHAAALGTKDAATAYYGFEPRFVELDARFDRQRMLAIGGYAVGSAAIAAGVYLVLRERRAERRLALAVGPDHVALSATWALGGP